MRRIHGLVIALALTAAAGLTLRTFAADAPQGDNPPQGQGQADNNRPPRPPAGYHLLPRFTTEQLKLTDDQKQQIADLEKETKAKLDKILTPEQKKILDNSRPPRPGQGGQGNQGGQSQGPGSQGGDHPNGPGGDNDGPPPQKQ